MPEDAFDLGDGTRDMDLGAADQGPDPEDMPRADMPRVDMPQVDMPSDMIADMPVGMCGDVECGAGQACQPATGMCTLPQSCLDRKAVIANTPNAPLPSDGFYQLFVEGDSGKPWWAWCDSMRTTSPRDYLPLAMTHEDHNVFERFGEPTQPGSVVGSSQPVQPLFQRRLTRTRYEKVRIDPYTLSIDVLDDTFASTEIFQDSEQDLDKFAQSVPFGVTQGCGLQIQDEALREDAQGRLDLRNTPFELNQRWSAGGVCAAQIDTSTSEQDQVISLNVSGGSASSTGCGVVAPDQMLDYYPSGCDQVGGMVTPATASLNLDDPLFAIQLAYVGGEGAMAKPRPKTCSEALLLESCVSDGVCNLYVGRRADRLWKAKCVDMATADPKTFIEIHLGRSNQTQDNNTSNKVNAQGSTTHGSFYGGLLLEGHSMRADVTDTTFAERTPGVPTHQLGTFAVSENCAVPANSMVQGAFARARVTIEETENQLRLASPLTPYGECVKFRNRVNSTYTELDSTPITDPISMAQLIYGGEVTTMVGDTRAGCGGLAPEPYALKQGYLDCREDATGSAYRPPRYSTQDELLFEFAHVSGNP